MALKLLVLHLSVDCLAFLVPHVATTRLAGNPPFPNEHVTKATQHSACSSCIDPKYYQVVQVNTHPQYSKTAMPMTSLVLV